MSALHRHFTVRYSSVPTGAVADKNISHGAFRVLIYIFSRPDGWKIYNNDIKKVIGIGKSHTLSKYWQELLNAGWISRKKIRNASGSITGGYDYILYDKPIMPIMDNMGEESTIMPIIGNAENSTNGQIGTHSNTDLTSIKNNTVNNVVSQETKPSRLLEIIDLAKIPEFTQDKIISDTPTVNQIDAIETITQTYEVDGSKLFEMITELSNTKAEFFEDFNQILAVAINQQLEPLVQAKEMEAERAKCKQSSYAAALTEPSNP